MGKNKTCIVAIDDNGDNLTSIKALINEFFPNIDVWVAKSGMQGIEIIHQYHPSVILLDIFMPEMDGFEVCALIKNNDLTKEIPVVFLTADKGDPDLRVKALECGAEAFLSKPIEVTELIAQIRSMIKIYEANIAKKSEKERLEKLVEIKTAELQKNHLQTLQILEELKTENNIRKASEKALLEAEKLAHLASFELNVKTDSLFWSEEILNILHAQSMTEITPLSKALNFVYPEDRETIIRYRNLAISEMKLVQFQFRILLFSGEIRYLDARFFPAISSIKKVIILRGSIQDITPQVLAEQHLLHMSKHDYLTGIFNRMYFEEMMIMLDKSENYPLSIVMADVNGLKMINDSFGHAKGDDILRKVALVLSEGRKPTDVVARLGGDEFVMMLPNTDETMTEECIGKMIASAEAKREYPVSLSISFGHSTKHKDNIFIQTVLKKAEDDMYRHKITESSSMRSKSVDLIMNALFAKSPREMNHSKRVSEICEAIAEKMMTTQDEINQVKTAGLLHDIGKIGVDESILNKNGKLDSDEWIEVKKHSEIGYRILSSVNEFSELARHILEHHEKMDGTGYPKGIKSEKISLQAKIIGVADAFDAMTSERTYRKGLTVEEAIHEIKKYSGSQFDPVVAKIFVTKVLEAEWEESVG